MVFPQFTFFNASALFLLGFLIEFVILDIFILKKNVDLRKTWFSTKLFLLYIVTIQKSKKVNTSHKTSFQFNKMKVRSKTRSSRKLKNLCSRKALKRKKLGFVVN